MLLDRFDRSKIDAQGFESITPLRQIEFGASLRVHSDNVALADADPPEPAGDLSYRLLVVDPSVVVVFALSHRLVERGRTPVSSGRFQ